MFLYVNKGERVPATVSETKGTLERCAWSEASQRHLDHSTDCTTQELV
jgi:hypothetical protein